MRASFILMFAAMLTMMVSATSLVAAESIDKQSDKIESVLDKLEKRYLDREAAPLTYEEQVSATKAPAKKPTEILDMTEIRAIEAETPNGKILKEIQAKIAEYENQVDALEADARKMKGNLIDSSAVDNQVSVDIKLKNPKTTSLRTLTANIDGSRLFNQTDPAGMWIPAKSIAIYQGPMQPGSHRLDVTAVLTKTNTDGVPVAGWNQQQVVQTFTINIPEGKVRKNIVIELDTGDAKNGKAVAKLDDLSSVIGTTEAPAAGEAR